MPYAPPATMIRSSWTRSPAVSAATCSPYEVAARASGIVTRLLGGRAKIDAAPWVHRTEGALSPRSSTLAGQSRSPGMRTPIPSRVNLAELFGHGLRRNSRAKSIPPHRAVNAAKDRSHAVGFKEANSFNGTHSCEESACCGIVWLSNHRTLHPLCALCGGEIK